MHIHFKNSFKKVLACLIFLLGFFWLLGEVTNTLSADPKIWLTSGESEGNVESEESRKVEEMIGLVKDPRLTGYVEEIGRRLVQQLRANLDSLELIVTGSRDDIAPAGMVAKLYPAWKPAAKFEVIQGADHFYGGYTDQLEAVLTDFLASG